MLNNFFSWIRNEKNNQYENMDGQWEQKQIIYKSLVKANLNVYIRIDRLYKLRQRNAYMAFSLKPDVRQS